MARINIEECWWSDPRRSMLIRLLGDEERADGAALKMWRVAQEFWKRDRQLIPRYIFDTLQFASELLRSALAEERDGFIYVRGSSQYLGWIEDNKGAGRLGGLKSAQVRREKYGTAQPKKAENVEANPEATSKQPEAFEASSSSSSSGSKEIKHEQRKRCLSVKSDFDLEAAYREYPRKRGKTPGLKKLAKEILTQADYEDLQTAIRNYALDVANKDPKYHLHFSSFANQWRDWIQIETPAQTFSINTKPLTLEEIA